MGKKKQIFKDDGVTEDFAAEALEPDEVDTDASETDTDAGVLDGELHADAPAEAVDNANADADAGASTPLTEDANGANPSSTDGGELAAAAKPPEDAPQAVEPSAENGLGATEGSDVIGSAAPSDPQAPAPAPAVPAQEDGQADAPADNLGVVDAGKDVPAEETTGEAAASSPVESSDAGKPSSDSSASSLEDSSSSDATSAPTEPQMPALADVHPEAKPIAEAAGDQTMGKFKDAGNLMTEGLESLREVEDKLERLGDEAKARLAHLRHKASEALAALEAWFSRS